MTTFINGKPGILDLIRLERDKNTSKLTTTGLSARRDRELRAEIGAYNLLLGWLGDDDTVLLTEAEYAQRFPTVPKDQHGTYEPTQHRYWVSWWSNLTFGVDAPVAPFQYWDTGHRFTDGPHTSYCAAIDSVSETAVWDTLAAMFPDLERRFISEKSSDWTPGDRFQ